MSNDTQKPITPSNDDLSLLRGRVVAQEVMLSQLTDFKALMCHLLNVPSDGLTAEIRQAVSDEIRRLQAAEKRPKVVYVSGKPKKNPTKH